MFNLSKIALALVFTLSGPAMAEDVVQGEKIFKKCKSCHKIGEGAKNSVGPLLTGVAGRQAAQVEGYKYSKTLQQAGEKGLIWSAETLSGYLEDPRAFMRAYLDDSKAKPKMSFKLKKEDQRADVIAYLATFSEAVEETALETVPDGVVCVTNKEDHSWLFAVENADGSRLNSELAMNETLCSEPATSTGLGTVSVFENEDVVEGCSRRIEAGTNEEMRRYADFDRCLWSSNDS